MFAEPCKENRREVSPPGCGALYVHVPFCLAKCRYCDFYSIALDEGKARQYVRAAKEELRRLADRLTTPLASAFVGGGTPTALGAEPLEELLGSIRPLVGEDTEFSVEANPSTIDETIAGVLVRAGANRVNVGVQSFRDEELRLLGRIHTPDRATGAIETIRAAGIDNVGLDLIYGIPDQTLDTWSASLADALALRPQHLSCYALSFEEGTPLDRQRQAGQVREMDESAQQQCYGLAISAAAGAGLEHYEISNFAQKGRRCRQNLTYWRNGPYLGIGPGAASYLKGVRRTNVSDVRRYAEALLAGRPAPATQERLTGTQAMAETVMLALRLIQGLDRQSFASRYGRDVLEVFPRSLARYADQGALAITPARIRITDEARFVSDTILAAVLAEA